MNELAKSAVKEIQPLWEAYQRSARRTEEQGVELGRICHKWQQKFGAQGKKGEGLHAILQEVNLPDRTAYHWINRYEICTGLKAAPAMAFPEELTPGPFRDAVERQQNCGPFEAEPSPSRSRSFEPENVTPEEEARVDQWYANMRTAPPLVLASRVSEEVRNVAREVVDAGNRVLAKARHPDCGGTVESMQVLNAAVDWLRREIAGGV